MSSNNPLWPDFVDWHQKNYNGSIPNLAIKDHAGRWVIFLRGAAAERYRRTVQAEDVGLVVTPEGPQKEK